MIVMRSGFPGGVTYKTLQMFLCTSFALSNALATSKSVFANSAHLALTAAAFCSFSICDTQRHRTQAKPSMRTDGRCKSIRVRECAHAADASGTSFGVAAGFEGNTLMQTSLSLSSTGTAR
jgi:hypothetical protein